MHTVATHIDPPSPPSSFCVCLIPMGSLSPPFLAPTLFLAHCQGNPIHKQCYI